jgi:hypothetical protein
MVGGLAEFDRATEEENAEEFNAVRAVWSGWKI